MSTEDELTAIQERQEDDKLIAEFLKMRVDVNAYDKWSHPSLIVAARRASPYLMRTLLEHGANPNIVDLYNSAIYEKPVDFWVVTGSLCSLHQNTVDDAEIIYEPGNPPLLEVAYEMGNEADSSWLPSQNEDVLQCMTLLLDYGADVDAKGPEGHTTLILMVRRAYPDAVRLLLARGADPTIQDTKGKNAFDYAKLPAEGIWEEERKADVRQILSQAQKFAE